MISIEFLLGRPEGSPQFSGLILIATYNDHERRWATRIGSIVLTGHVFEEEKPVVEGGVIAMRRVIVLSRKDMISFSEEVASDDIAAMRMAPKASPDIRFQIEGYDDAYGGTGRRVGNIAEGWDGVTQPYGSHGNA